LTYWVSDMKKVNLNSVRESYRVFVRRWFYSEIDDPYCSEWVLLGETTAKSEAQAISNVRHNKYGDVYMTGIGEGSWGIDFEFEAFLKRSGNVPEGYKGACGTIGEYGLIYA